MRNYCVLVGILAVGVSLAQADPYWVSWEGEDWPENQGWTRVWGNWDGQYQGPGAHRTLENGILTYDSLYDNGVYDFQELFRPGEIDPTPGEVFVAEWRLRVDQVVGRADPGVGVSSDQAWSVGFQFGYDRIYSVFEHFLEIPFEPGVFHAYRMTSPSMIDYQLYIDGELARQGRFTHLVEESRLHWGEGVQGAASLHEWDYVRFGVPEPSVLWMMVVVVAWLVARGR
jgi:hypothetical protein